jgi:predicted nucleotidyltransferase component of viral defense system
MLQYQTVTDSLLKVLRKWILIEELADFKLVGGTALSLLYGHRQSVDIDFFTPNEISENFRILLQNQKNLTLLLNGKYHIAAIDDNIKIDFTYWNMNFEEFDKIDGIKMASPLDIFGMKLDAITSRRTRKDYYDIAELTNQFGFGQGFERYNKLLPYSRNSQIILESIGGIADADETEEPILLKNQNWEDVKHFLKKEAKKYFLNL